MKEDKNKNKKDPIGINHPMTSPLFYSDDNRKAFFQQVVSNCIVKVSKDLGITIEESIQWTKDLANKLKTVFLDGGMN